MSGGHWDYRDQRIQYAAEEVADDKKVKERFPRLAVIFAKLGTALADIAHDIDWDISLDSFIEDEAGNRDDAGFERAAIERLRAIVGESSADAGATNAGAANGRREEPR